MNQSQESTEFVIKDCALAAISTGQRAQTLRELSDRIASVHPGCIYHHFWGGLLRPRFDDPEYNNDFASWVRYALHDSCLAERLAIIDPADYADIDALRQVLIDVIESRIDELDYRIWANPDQMFHFVRLQIVVFDTTRRLQHPHDLVTVIPELSLGSIYYHFIDARRREPKGVDDFRAWIGQFGEHYAPLCTQLSELDPYFINLAGLRQRLTHMFADFSWETT